LGLDPNTYEEKLEWIDARDTPPNFNNGADWAFDKQINDNFLHTSVELNNKLVYLVEPLVEKYIVP